MTTRHSRSRHSRRTVRPPSRRFCCRRSLGAYALGLLLFVPGGIVLLLTAHAHVRPTDADDEPAMAGVPIQLPAPHNEQRAAADARAAASSAMNLHELQQAQVAHQQRQQYLLRHIHDEHEAQASAAAAAAAEEQAARALPSPPPPPLPLPLPLPPPPPPPPRLAPHGQATMQRERDPGAHKLASEDLIRAALDDVGLEGILGELSESTRRESSEGKELLRQQRASAALRLHEKLSEEEVLRLAEDALPPEQGQPRLWGDLEGDAAGQKYRLPCFEDSAPSDRLVPCRALAAPTQPGA